MWVGTENVILQNNIVKQKRLFQTVGCSTNIQNSSQISQP